MVKIYYTTKKLEENYHENNFPKAVINHVNNKKSLKSQSDTKRGWELLRIIILNELLLEIKNLDIIFSENGKPMTNNFFFSLSHSNDLTAVAISDKEIGIDCELVKNDEKILNLAKKLLMDKTDISIQNFYKYFTSYEANIKYLGKTLGYPKSNLKDLENAESFIINKDSKQYMVSVVKEGTSEINEY